MNRPKGALFFWEDEPHVTGYLTIGDEHYELAGVRRSKVRTDFEGRQQERERQRDMFDEPRGEGTG